MIQNCLVKTRYIVCMVLLLSLAGCSSIPGVNRLVGEDGMFRDRQGDYLEAEVISRTEVPPGLDDYVIDDLYMVPEANTNSNTFIQPPRPRPLEGRSEREVVIQRLEDRSWVVVDASPSQVWPRVRDYWTSKGIELAYENPTQGTMETGWFMLQGNPLSQEKFRVFIEPGFQDQSTEVRLLHVSVPQSVPSLGEVDWPETSHDQELAYNTLTDLSTYLADVSDLYQASSVSFLAGNIPSEGKASMVRTPAGSQLLRLEADFERSWAAVGRALERAGVEIAAQDYSKGVYEVSFVISSEKEEGNFLSRLVTLERFRGDDEIRTHELRIQLIDTDSAVEVLVENLAGDTADASPEENQESPAAALLRTIMNNIA